MHLNQISPQLKKCDLYLGGDLDFGYPADVKPGSFAISVCLYLGFPLTEAGANRAIHVHIEMLQLNGVVGSQSMIDSF